MIKQGNIEHKQTSAPVFLFEIRITMIYSFQNDIIARK